MAPTEREIQDFWSEHPMIFPWPGLDRRTATPEEIFAHTERMMRMRGDGLHQAAGAPLMANFIDFPSLRGKRVLEIGFGVGWLLKELADAGAEVHGIDLSRSHAALSSHRFKDDKRVSLQIASAERCPFPDNHFDFVASWGVLDHAENDQKCFDEVHRVLKPGGRAFFMLYRKGGPKYWWWKIFRLGILKGGIARNGWSVERFINSVTDAYEGEGDPISRHYTRRDLVERFRKFSEVRLDVSGNRNEWDMLPAHRLPLTNWLLSRPMRDRLVQTSGAYWIVHLRK